MKNRVKKSRDSGKIVTKSVSLPHDLFVAAEGKWKADPELDFSKYVRRLVRADLALEEAKSA